MLAPADTHLRLQGAAPTAGARRRPCSCPARRAGCNKAPPPGAVRDRRHLESDDGFDVRRRHTHGRGGDPCIDTSRVELEGFSQGGAMAWNLACLRPGTFRAAVGHSSGGLAARLRISVAAATAQSVAPANPDTPCARSCVRRAPLPRRPGRPRHGRDHCRMRDALGAPGGRRRGRRRGSNSASASEPSIRRSSGSRAQ